MKTRQPKSKDTVERVARCWRLIEDGHHDLETDLRSKSGKVEHETLWVSRIPPSLFFRDLNTFYYGMEVIKMKEYSYEDVKKAYMAIIEVGRKRVVGVFGPFSAQVQHRQNLKELDGSAKELYEKLLNDDEINY